MSLWVYNIAISQTDKESYGFKDSVKIVSYFIYNDFSGVPSDTQDKVPHVFRILYFNSKGNIDSIVETLSETYISEKFITLNYHANHRLKSSKRMKYGTSDIIEESKYHWKENNMKCEFKSIGLSTFSEGYRRLNWKNREIAGHYLIKTKKGQIVLDESYQNEIDSSGVLLQTTYQNPMKGDYVIEYIDSKYDAKGNLISVFLRNKKTKRTQRYIRKEFQYYN